MDLMIEFIEGAKRQSTPNETALSILLSALTIIFLVVCISLKPFAYLAGPTWTRPCRSACWCRFGSA